MNTALELWRAAGWTMLHFLWLGTLFGLLALITRTAVRRAPPWLRYSCALFWFVAIAVTPLAIGTVVLQQSAPHVPTLVAPQPLSPLPISAMSEVGPLPLALDFPVIHEAADRISRQSNDSGKANATIGAGWQYWFATVQPLAEWTCDWLPWVWLCGSPLVMCLLLSGVVGADRLRRDAELLVSHPVGAQCHRCARSLGIRRRVLIGVSQRIAAPLLVGIVRPMILLPPAVLGECSAEQIEMILWHELAHVRRWDNLVNLIQRLVEALLFFHPVVWRVSAWVRLEREHCCDAVVLRHVAEPRAYAETLAALAMPELSPRLATASLSNHQLVSRIRHILNLEDRAMKVSHKLALVLSVGIISLGVFTYSRAQQLLKPPTAPTHTEPRPSDVSAYAGQIAGEAGPAVSATPGAPSGAPAAILRHQVGSGLVVEVGPPIGGGIVASVPVEGGGPGSNGTASPAADVPAALSAGSVPGADARFNPHATIARETNGQPGMMQMVHMSRKGPPWSAEQASGAPDTPKAGDFATAWASATPDGQEEWLRVEFNEPIEIAAVLINETFNPGAVKMVQASDLHSNNVLATWSGVDPVARDRGKGLAIIPLHTPTKAQLITITVDSANVPGWNEIDAVGVLDTQGGTHWAARAMASSTFNADAIGGRILLSRGVRVDYDGGGGGDRVGHLEQQVHQLQQSLDEIKSLLKAQTAPTGGASVPGKSVVPAVPQPGGGASLNTTDRLQPPNAGIPILPPAPPAGTGGELGAGGGAAPPKPSATGTPGASAPKAVIPPALYGVPILERLFVPGLSDAPAAAPVTDARTIQN